MAVIQIAIGDLDTWLTNQPTNTPETPYELDITGITDSTTFSTFKTVMSNHRNDNKYLDLSHTTITATSGWRDLFYNSSILIKSPPIPQGTTDMSYTYRSCTNLKEIPEIPSSVLVISGMCYGCESLTEVPTLPSGLLDAVQAFQGCRSITSTGNLNLNSLKDCQYMFALCWNLQTVQNFPPNARDIKYMFLDCPNLREFNAIIPSTVQNAIECFKDCTNLTTIKGIAVPLNTIKNNTKFRYMFWNCTSLTTVGFNTEAGDWHLFSVKIGSNNISAKIYDRNKNVTTIPSTSITKSTLKLPLLTDELWFPDSNTSDQDIEDVIDDVLTNKYTYFNETALDPTAKSFVMYADDPSNFVTNLPIASSPVDVVESGNMNSVTSNAVANGGSTIINGLTEGTSDPVDADYYVAQYVGGGTTTTTYHRRKHSSLWNYIKGKILDVVYGNPSSDTSSTYPNYYYRITGFITNNTNQTDAFTFLINTRNDIYLAKIRPFFDMTGKNIVQIVSITGNNQTVQIVGCAYLFSSTSESGTMEVWIKLKCSNSMTQFTVVDLTRKSNRTLVVEKIGNDNARYSGTTAKAYYNTLPAGTIVTVDSTPTQDSTNLITSGGVYNKLGVMECFNFSKSDNSGYPTMRLLYDITDWWNSSSGVAGVGLTGVLYEHRSNGYTMEGVYTIASMFSYGRGTNTVEPNGDTNRYSLDLVRLNGTREGVSLAVVKTSSKYYIALILKGSNHSVRFFGTSAGTLLNTELMYTSSTNLPSGYTIEVLSSTVKKSNLITQESIDFITSGAVHSALSGFLYRNNTSSSKTIKISNIYPTEPTMTNVYSLSARNGEFGILSCGTTDGSEIVAPEFLRLVTGTAKIGNIYYKTSDKTVIITVGAYTHFRINQINGKLTTISIEEVTSTSGYTAITRKQVSTTNI